MRHSINGYVFTANCDAERAYRLNRYLEIRALHASVVERSCPYMGKTVYSGTLPSDHNLSPLDIAILCDGGNTCFGGIVETFGLNFTCTIWTD